MFQEISRGRRVIPNRVDAARRCADLLAALARTANVARACGETGISKYWAYRRRAADPDFARRWCTAMRAGERRAARVAEARARRSGGDPRAAGAGLIVQGRAGTNTRRLQPAARDSFTEERRAAFLDALRATCNVQASCRATGAGSTTAYHHYHSDAAFRAAWDAALAEGRVHLEMALLGAARAVFEAAPEQAHPPVAPDGVAGMDAKVAVQLLRLHGPRDAAGRVRARWVKPADPEATRAEILAKVAAVRAARGREGAERVPASIQASVINPLPPSRERVG